MSIFLIFLGVCAQKNNKLCCDADVEEWSWIERRRDGGAIQLNTSKHSLQDLALFAREGKRGVCPGASVHRRSDGLWIPLTEVCSALAQSTYHQSGDFCALIC